MMRRIPAVVMSFLLAWMLAAPARAWSQELPTTECAISPASLPLATEGIAYNASILTSTSPDLGGMSASNLPPGLALVERYVRGTPTTPGTFSISLKKNYRYASRCGKVLSKKPGDPESSVGSVSIETVTLKVHDSHPPTIGSFTVTPETLGYAGGNVTLTAQAADNVAVARIMMTTRHPDGHSGSALVPMTGGTAANGTWSISFALSGNATTAPASYTFTVAASDADGNTTNAGPKTIVVDVRGAPPLRLQPPQQP